MPLHWISNAHAELNGVPLDFVNSNYSEHKTDDNRIVVLKPKPWFDTYREILYDIGDEAFNLVELGIFEGGSALLFAEYFKKARLIGFDLRDESASVLRHLNRMGYADRVRLHYRTSQSDEEKLHHSISEWFGEAPIHLVIDDASHHYEHTRASFEILYPLVAPGGRYVIEDWAWAHWPVSNYDNWGGIAMSSLILQLVMALASNPKIFGKIEVRPQMVIVHKPVETPRTRLNLDAEIKIAPRSWQPLQLK